MGFTTAARDAAIDAVAALGNWLSLHTADPGTTGADEVSGTVYGREQTTWETAVAVNVSGSQVTFSVPSGNTVTHWGVWDSETGGTFVCGGALSAPATFDADGTYNFTPTLTTSVG